MGVWVEVPLGIHLVAKVEPLTDEGESDAVANDPQSEQA